MKRFMVQADEALIRRMRKRANERGVSVAALGRESIERSLGNDRQPFPHSIGKHRSGRRHDARRAGAKFVAEPWRSS